MTSGNCIQKTKKEMHMVPTQHHGSEEIAAFLTNALISGIIYEKDTKKICLRNPQGVIDWWNFLPHGNKTERAISG
jgi:hypothetical protein